MTIRRIWDDCLKGCSHHEQLSKDEFVIEHLLELSTYDEAIDIALAPYVHDTIVAITEGVTFDYIETSDEARLWFTVICNLPWFVDKIEWGSSIRVATWRHKVTLESCALFDKDGEQMRGEFQFTRDIWSGIMRSLVTWWKG